MDNSVAEYELVDCGPEEYEEVVALWNRSGLSVRREGRDGPEAFERQASTGIQRVIGLRSPSAVLVAVAVLTHDGRKGWINRLAVDPGRRRHGLARRLLDEAEQWFTRDLGLEVWAALIEGHNRESQAMFAALGFYTHDVIYVTKRTRAEA